MKKIAIIPLLSFIIALSFIGCASSSNKTRQSKQLSQTVFEEPSTTMRILDWANRNLDEEQKPAWLKQLVRGKSNSYKEERGLDQSYIIKWTTFRAKNRNIAATVADVQFAAQVANDLKRIVLTRAGASMQAGDFEALSDTVTEAKVTITGSQRQPDFWQEIETTDNTTGRKTREFVVYAIYAFKSEAWDELFSYYMKDVMKDFPEGPGKKTIRNMFDEIAIDTRREIERSEAQFKAELKAREDKIKNEHELAMARTNQETAKAQQTAYKSGNPAKIAEASTSAGDEPWVNSLSTAAKVLF